MRILAEREKTHGNYDLSANVSQMLKEILRVQPNWEKLTDRQRESLEMICLKLSRIVSGSASFRDHWDDVEGYARLGGESVTDNDQIKLDLTLGGLK